MTRALRFAAIALAAGVLAGCGAVKPLPGPGRLQLALPPGDWKPLGAADEAFAGRPVPPQTAALRTEAYALHGADGRPLAVLLLQANMQGDPRVPSAWSAPCAEQRGLRVEDRAQSPMRIDCLRYKPWADSQGWLQSNEPALAGWVARQAAAPAQPYAYLHYRYSTDTGAYLAIQALVDHRLLIPEHRSNDGFLRAGQPGREWSDELARRARVSTAMLDGYLPVPPFPIALNR